MTVSNSTNFSTFSLLRAIFSCYQLLSFTLLILYYHSEWKIYPLELKISLQKIILNANFFFLMIGRNLNRECCFLCNGFFNIWCQRYIIASTCTNISLENRKKYQVGDSFFSSTNNQRDKCIQNEREWKIWQQYLNRLYSFWYYVARSTLIVTLKTIWIDVKLEGKKRINFNSENWKKSSSNCNRLLSWFLLF